MTRNSAVVVGADGSEHARFAALRAAAEADRRGRPLRIVYGADLDRLTRLASVEAIEQIREAGRVLLLETAVAVQERFPGEATCNSVPADAATGRRNGRLLGLADEQAAHILAAHVADPLTAQGFRVLAVASAERDEAPTRVTDAEAGLRLLGPAVRRPAEAASLWHWRQEAGRASWPRG